MNKLNIDFNFAHMINVIKYLVLFPLVFLLNHCSFDHKTGIWKGYEQEIKRVAKLEKENRIIKSKIFASSDEFSKEIASKKSVKLNTPQNYDAWTMANLNLQNSLGNLYLEGTRKKFLKKRVGKNKIDMMQKISPPLFFKNYIILSDDNGSIFKINKKGRKVWKVNIYKKIYKKLYKNLTFALYEDNIYVADNIGFVYLVNFITGEVVWKKNFGIPFKSRIKVYDNKIFIVDQDNRMLCLDSKDGSIIWDILTIKTFIKSIDLLGLAISEKGYLIFSNSAGDVIKANISNGGVQWSMNSLISKSTFDSDFFKTSDIVIDKEVVIFSNISSTFSLNLDSGYANWISKITSSHTPIIDGNNIFLITDNGYFVNLDKRNGKILWSTNIFKVLKKKLQKTYISGFILGSDKIYITTLNGYLITCSALTGKVENKKRIAFSINSAPIIINGELYVLTTKSRILGFR